MSLSQLIVVDSIQVPGDIRNIAMSDDGNRLYGSVADQGRVVSIDLDSRQITASLDLQNLLGAPTVGDVVEVGPGDLVVGAYDPTEVTSYVVHVRLADPSGASRIACSEGYGGTAIWKSPDKKYLYIATDTLRCPLLEKRDLTQPGFPIIQATELGNPNTGLDLGRHAMSKDGRYIYSQNLDVIDTKTLWSLGFAGPGPAQPLASNDPDRLYASDGPIVITLNVPEYRILKMTQFPCDSAIWGIAELRARSDESTFYLLGHDGAVCVVNNP
jgi:hypothetical protein